MRTLKAAILFDPSRVRPGEIESALSGLREFGRFGVACEGIDASRSGLWDLKRAQTHRSAIRSESLAVHPFDLHHSSVWEFMTSLFVERDRMGIALTDAVLFSLEGEKRSRSLGLSAYGIGGMVSVSRLREVCHRQQELSAIKLAVMHEAGHILGRKDHCANENCLMQENRDHLDFVGRFVERGLGLCRDCADKVAAGVSELGSFHG